MRKVLPEILEKGRLYHPMFPPTKRGDRFGIFEFGELKIIASDGSNWDKSFDERAWEHVSVSHANRCPTWDEMCQVKSLFWDDDECVQQFHPPGDRYVNAHPYCLHLWKQVGVEVPMPPVGAV